MSHDSAARALISAIYPVPTFKIRSLEYFWRAALGFFPKAAPLSHAQTSLWAPLLGCAPRLPRRWFSPGHILPSAPLNSLEELTSAMHQHSLPQHPPLLHSGGLSFSEKATPVGSTRIKARWACEWCKEEAETYQLNHPGCMVFHLDCEVFLQVCPCPPMELSCPRGVWLRRSARHWRGNRPSDFFVVVDVGANALLIHRITQHLFHAAVVVGRHADLY